MLGNFWKPIQNYSVLFTFLTDSAIKFSNIREKHKVKHSKNAYSECYCAFNWNAKRLF